MTRFLLRSMVISRTGTIQISTLRHKKNTESAILFVRFHIWCLIWTGSSSADKALNFCMTKYNCLTSLSTYWFWERCLQPQGTWDAAVQPWTMQLLQSNTWRFFFHFSKQVLRLPVFIFLDNSRLLMESETNLDKDRVLVLRAGQQSINLITELPLK